MRILLTLILMLFLHCIADFHFQGALAKMKQKDWWIAMTKIPRDRFRNSIYRNDYIVALMAHGFEWCCIVCSPMYLAAWQNQENPKMSVVCVGIALANGFVHAVVDDLKVNGGNSLVVDQLIHIIQIIMMWAIWSIAYGW